MNKIVIISLLGAFLSGCSFIFGDDSPFRDRSNDYLKSTAIGLIVVPEDLDRDALGQLYVVPEAGDVPDYQLDTEFEVPRVMPNLDQANTSGVKIQRLGNDSWILASSSPGETWPRVRNFLSDNGMPTEFANASTGTIDTGWVELNEVVGLVNQFRLRLEQGVQINTTEIIIQQRQYAVDALPPTLPNWLAEGSDDAEQEEWLRTNLATALASEDLTSSASLLGQEIGAAVKIELETPEKDNPYMVMHLNAVRAWASIEYALNTRSFNLLESGFDAGIEDSVGPINRADSDVLITHEDYFEFYEDTPEDISWFGKLRGKRNPEPGVYKLIMVEDDGSQFIRIYHTNGDLVEAREAYLVLTRLRNNLT
tara:strand:+ start:70030 stop:71130 length:1101 start_codon:yes stop_codon:yes gene_type:complete